MNIIKSFALLAATAILTSTVYAHGPTNVYSLNDPNLCDKLEAGIDNGVFPDGRDVHNYYEKCGYDNVPQMAEGAIDKMESIIRHKLGPEHPFNKNQKK